jgi:hypothetical protein
LPTSNGTQGVMVFGNRTEVRATTAADNLQVREEAPPPSSPSGGGQQPLPVSPSVRGIIEVLFFLRISLGKPAVRKHGVRVAGRGQFSSPLRAFYALYPPERSKTRTPRLRARRWLSGTNSWLHFSINVQDCSVLRMHMLLCRRRY